MNFIAGVCSARHGRLISAFCWWQGWTSRDNAHTIQIICEFLKCGKLLALILSFCFCSTILWVFAKIIVEWAAKKWRMDKECLVHNWLWKEQMAACLGIQIEVSLPVLFDCQAFVFVSVGKIHFLAVRNIRGWKEIVSRRHAFIQFYITWFLH